MIDLSKLITLDKSSSDPIYLQISNQIIDLVNKGILLAGVKIQTSRDLAVKLKVHRNTVVASYTELQLQGWIMVKERKGCFIETKLPTLSPVHLPTEKVSDIKLPEEPGFELRHELIDQLSVRYPSTKIDYVFNEGFPDVRLTPLKELLQEYQRIGTRKISRRHLSYSAKEGSPRLRQELVSMLRETRGMNVAPENVLVTKGAQMAIYLACSLLLKPGDKVIVGVPGYFLVREMLKRLGAIVIEVPVDDDGIDVDTIEAICKQQSIRMIYVIPHHHHPTTVTLSGKRRLQLLRLASSYKIAIVEDDFDFDIHYENSPTLPMASQDRDGNIIYIGTFTKVLAPTIRLGYIVAPVKFTKLMAQHRFMIDMQGDNLLEEAMAELLSNGVIERHLKKIRRLYKARRDHLCELLTTELGNQVTFKIPDGGMCLWVRFNEVDTLVVSKEAEKRGLFIRDGKKHNTHDQDFNAICIGFASMNIEELTAATNVLVEVVKGCKKQQTGLRTIKG